MLQLAKLKLKCGLNNKKLSGQYLYSYSDHVEMVVWNKVTLWYRVCQFTILNDDAKSQQKTCKYHVCTSIYFIFEIVNTKLKY